MSQIYDNVVSLYEKYSNKIKSDKHLILLYMREIDGVLVDKENISTPDFLSKSTDITAIVQCSNMHKIVKGEEING